MSTNSSTKTAYITAISGGVILWLGTMAASGKAEAWDASIYWAIAYPLAILLAGWLGYRHPIKPWRWGLAVMLSQALLLVIVGSDFSLLPLGLILFAVLALPAIAVAKIAAKIRLRRKN